MASAGAPSRGLRKSLWRRPRRWRCCARRGLAAFTCGGGCRAFRARAGGRDGDGGCDHGAGGAPRNGRRAARLRPVRARPAYRLGFGCGASAGSGFAAGTASGRGGFGRSRRRLPPLRRGARRSATGLRSRRFQRLAGSARGFAARRCGFNRSRGLFARDGRGRDFGQQRSRRRGIARKQAIRRRLLPPASLTLLSRWQLPTGGVSADTVSHHLHRRRLRRQWRAAVHAVAERAQDRGKIFAGRSRQRGHRLRHHKTAAIERAGGLFAGRGLAPGQRGADQIGEPLQDVDAHRALAALAVAEHAIGVARQRLVDRKRGAARSSPDAARPTAPTCRHCPASRPTAATPASAPRASAAAGNRCDRRRTARRICATSRARPGRDPSSRRKSSRAPARRAPRPAGTRCRARCR